MNKVIFSDYYRWGTNFKKRVPQIRFMYYKRKCEIWRHNKVVYIIYRFFYRKYQIKFNTDIPASTKIGYGFKIRHLGGIVINPNVIIGNNVDILNGVLLGQEDRGDRKGCPTIGDNVFIGTNAIVVGKIVVGNNVLIAPGSFVNFDVPNDSIVVGNPGKVISNVNATSEYIYNPFFEDVNY